MALAAALGHGAPAIAIVTSASLVCLGHVVGDAIGSRIQHPGHLLPACVVGGCADLISVAHPAGPTHAIVSSERALALAAISFPVPGTRSFAPALGIGDLLFVALIFAAARIHKLPRRRVFALCAGGIAVAGVMSALLMKPVPALPTIAAAVLLGVPRARILARSDRSTALAAMAIAVGLVAWLAVQHIFGR